ncbi:hypothetical protein V8B97DRAFT_958909 [Scleroderma yunnanense]
MKPAVVILVLSTPMRTPHVRIGRLDGTGYVDNTPELIPVHHMCSMYTTVCLAPWSCLRSYTCPRNFDEEPSYWACTSTLILRWSLVLATKPSKQAGEVALHSRDSCGSQGKVGGNDAVLVAPRTRLGGQMFHSAWSDPLKIRDMKNSWLFLVLSLLLTNPSDRNCV